MVVPGSVQGAVVSFEAFVLFIFPVVVDGRLSGIVSIGDVVKTRMEELEREQQQLQAYITQG